MPFQLRISALTLLAATLTTQATAQLVFSNDFESPLPTQIAPGSATLTGVQFFAGLGHPGNQFAGSFLRSATGNVITITLTDLPVHTSLSLEFLLAAIDSLDGTGNFPEGDFLRITLDGNIIFRESFANATESQVQSYIPPPGVQLARRIDLGFGGPGSYYTDSAYDLGADPNFQNLPHNAATAVFTFQIEGPGIQDINDESWAMDNLRVTLAGGCGTADFNGDGDFGTDADIEAFFACLAGTCCPTCYSGGSDFNADGDIGTDADIESFFRVLAAGPC